VVVVLAAAKPEEAMREDRGLAVVVLPEKHQPAQVMRLLQRLLHLLHVRERVLAGQPQQQLLVQQHLAARVDARSPSLLQKDNVEVVLLQHDHRDRGNHKYFTASGRAECVQQQFETEFVVFNLLDKKFRNDYDFIQNGGLP